MQTLMHIFPFLNFQVNLPKGYGYVHFKTRGEAEKALNFMDGVGCY